MVTTIQESERLVNVLQQKRMYNKETYEEVIWDLLEDSMEISEETRKHLDQSKKEIAEGKTVSLEGIKKKMGI